MSSMGNMSMGNGMPSMFTLQEIYWVVVGNAVGLAALINIVNRLIARHRYLQPFH